MIDRPVRTAPIELFRAAVGLLVCAYFVRCFREAALYSAPDGLLDHALSETFNRFTVQPLFRPWAPAWWPRAVFGFAAALSLVMAAGVRARACAAVLYVVAVCAYRWNFLVLYVDDALMHLLLFWVIMLPEGQRFTWRALTRRREARARTSGWAPGATLRLCLLNIALLYAVAGLTKWTSVMWRDGSAVYAIFRHPIAWSPGLFNPHYRPLLALFGWASMIVEPLLVLAVILPKHHRVKYALLAGALALHLGIALTLDLVFANVGCLVLAILVFHEELADLIDRDAPMPPASVRAPWTWRERVASLAVALLFVAMGCATLQPQWRQPLAARGRETARSITPETGGVVQSAAFAGLWCMGLAQQYRLLDWIDERDVHLVTSGVEELHPTGERRAVSFDAIVPRTTRGVLLVSYLTGFTWSPLPARDVRRLRASLTERMAARYCRERPSRASVRAGVVFDRSSAPVTASPMRVTLTFRCEGSTARDAQLATFATPD